MLIDGVELISTLKIEMSVSQQGKRIRKTQKCLIELKSLNFVIKDTKHTKEGG